MRFENATATTFAGALAVSSTMAYVRSREEQGRRSGLKGTSVVQDSEGRLVEYDYPSMASDASRPVLVLESGLGAPLECWDWITYLLGDTHNVLRYHRAGYARTRSRLRPARLLELLLRHYAPSGPVILGGHSIGSLVLANALAESDYVRGRASSVFIIDGTDTVLLDADRNSTRHAGRYKQDSMRRALGSVTGVNRWVTSPVERDLEYRPDIQRAYLTFESSLRSIKTAQREFFTEPIEGQDFLARLDLPRYVLSAENNSSQQRTLADRISAEFHVVPSSGHRSIIGRLSCAQDVAALIRDRS